MAGNNTHNHNEESQMGPHPGARVPTNQDVPMAALRERLEALRPRNGNGSRSQIDETNPPTGAELTNLLLLEMLQKQGEQLRLQNEQIQRLMEVKEKRAEEDNSYMFKRFASHHPPVYDGTPDPKTFEDWIRGMEKLFDALQCPEEWKVGFAVFYLKDKADLWWATIRERQHEPGFGWGSFKEMIKDHFYPTSLQKAKENEFMQLQQGSMSVLEYASKFMELSRFAPAFVADERLKMNRFEAGLKPTIKKWMSVRQYASYVDLYDTTVNVERAMKERSHYFNEQRGIKRKGDNRGDSQMTEHNCRPTGGLHPGSFNRGGQSPILHKPMSGFLPN